MAALHARTHPTLDVEGMKECKGCGLHLAHSEFNRHHATRDRLRPRCRACASAQAKASGRSRKSHLLRNYGLDEVDYMAMVFLQDNKCAICGDGPSGRFKYLCVDHDHNTGTVRQLLCDRCNRGLGQFKDNLGLMRQAIDYLESHAV